MGNVYTQTKIAIKIQSYILGTPTRKEKDNNLCSKQKFIPVTCIC